MSEVDTQSDLLVIGGGSAGLALAIRAARHGARVTLFEPRELGGTCVNRGCVPKKAMWWAAELAHMQRLALEIGFDGACGALDWPAFVARRNAYVLRARQAYAKRLDECGVRVVAQVAHFVDAHTLQANGKHYRAPHIAIATGSRSRVLDLPGAELGIDSDGFFELLECPKRVGVIGGGYIAVELAGVLHALGAHVELFSRRRLLSQFDADLGDALGASMTNAGIHQQCGCAVSGALQVNGALWLDCADHARHGPYDQLIWAVGRVPDVEKLQLDAAGVVCGDDGQVVTDAYENASVPGIYALGDVNGGPAFTHISYNDFIILRTNLLHGGTETTAGRLVPNTVFIDPQLGRVGLNEREAHAQGRKIRVAKLPMTSVARAMEMDETRGFMKAVVDAESDQILGCAILGVEGGEIMSIIEVAMMGHLPCTVLKNAVLAHPTLAESLNNLFSTLEE